MDTQPKPTKLSVAVFLLFVALIIIFSFFLLSSVRETDTLARNGYVAVGLETGEIIVGTLQEENVGGFLKILPKEMFPADSSVGISERVGKLDAATIVPVDTFRPIYISRGRVVILRPL